MPNIKHVLILFEDAQKEDMMNDNDMDYSRIERLLAMILINQMVEVSEQDKIIALSQVGFSNKEISNLLNKSASAITQSLYRARKST